MNALSLITPVLGFLIAPLLLGIINRTKAVFAGRNGQPLLQPYYDIWKLLNKGAVYSRTTTWIFRAGPIIGLAAVATSLFLVPFAGLDAPLAFEGDLILFAGLLGLGRFFTVIAALDTGSAFEGMGASREVQFSAIVEPVLYLAFAALVQASSAPSLSVIYSNLTFSIWGQAGPMLGLIAGTLLVVFLAENARIPVDDPTTHLELTMIHEVMVLDHSGPDFALISYGATLKHWVLGVLIVGLLLPLHTPYALINVVLSVIAMFLLAIVIGVIESIMARLRLLRVPQLLVAAGALSALAIFIVMRQNL